MIKNAKFSGHCFYMNTNTWGDFQIYINVPLILGPKILYLGIFGLEFWKTYCHM